MRDSSLSPSSRLGGAVISDRIVSALLEELRTGRYAQTDRLPAEVDLAAELSVSRTVIRDALSEMERAGYIERVRGIGTVVNRSVLNLRSRLDQKLEYYPLIRSFGSYPHADGIQIYPVRAGEELARDLAIEPGDDVICIKKRILADTTPVIYSSTTCPAPCLGAGTTPASTCRVTSSMFWSGSAASRWPPMWPTSRPAAATSPSGPPCVWPRARLCCCWMRYATTGSAIPSCVR